MCVCVYVGVSALQKHVCLQKNTSFVRDEFYEYKEQVAAYAINVDDAYSNLFRWSIQEHLHTYTRRKRGVREGLYFLVELAECVTKAKTGKIIKSKYIIRIPATMIHQWQGSKHHNKCKIILEFSSFFSKFGFGFAKLRTNEEISMPERKCYTSSFSLSALVVPFLHMQNALSLSHRIYPC